VSPVRVRRFEHGSRVPGWDEAVDLAKDPAKVPDPATTPVDPALRIEIEAHMAKYPDHRSAAIPALAAAQRTFGWLSPEAMEQVACVMRLTPAYLDAVATFYDMLETEPKGRHDVYVCTNISCSMRGGRELLQAIADAAGEDPDFNVRGFECLGACDIAPMASVDGVYVGPLDVADAQRLVDDARAGRAVLPELQLIRRPVADPDANTAVPGPPAAFGAPMGSAEPATPPGAEAAAAHGEQPMTEEETRDPVDPNSDEDHA
jgi:NADH-quinone oxidoreductase subunit E